MAVSNIETMAALQDSDAACVGCGARMELQHELDGHAVTRCPSCGLYALHLDAPRHDASRLERTEFEGALRELRLENYAFILDQLERGAPLAGRKLLDVGCSSGWFLEAARRAGCRCYGIEPDEFFFVQARAAAQPGVEVAHGSFPRDLPAEWAPFDLITFHDVFEHLPEPEAILRACNEMLTPDGRLVLSLPSADGFVFRLAGVLGRLGLRGPLARVFQVKYPYPHLFYFNPRSLAVLAERVDLVVQVQRLRAFSSRGALHRSRMDRTDGVLSGLLAYLNAGALMLFALVERLLPADNVLVVLRRKGNRGPASKLG